MKSTKKETTGTEFEVVEQMPLDEFDADEWEDMDLRATLLHDKEQNTDPEKPNRHAVIVGELAFIIEGGHDVEE